METTCSVVTFAVPDGVDDMTALFASDAAATGWTSADQIGVQAGDVVAVWGAGGVGRGYRLFKEEEDGCVRAVFRPGG